ncbi:MAG: hypothetical protein NT154_28610 [Verrucomicrobia bacterium]|nr:hypothetical protein [Verrucomicrobiota bacterium]
MPSDKMMAHESSNNTASKTPPPLGGQAVGTPLSRLQGFAPLG